MALGMGVRVNARTRSARAADKVASRNGASVLIHKLPGDRRHPRRARDCGPGEEIAYRIYIFSRPSAACAL